MLLFTASAAILFILLAMFIPETATITLGKYTVPWSLAFLTICGLCTSVMWACIFNLATEGLGKYTAQASGIFMMMVVGGGVLPVVQNFFADIMGYMPSYFIYLIGMAYMFYYALLGCKNVNTDIKVD